MWIVQVPYIQENNQVKEWYPVEECLLIEDALQFINDRFPGPDFLINLDYQEAT